MTQSNYVLITILVCALCTQVTRWLPFLLFGLAYGAGRVYEAH